MEPATERLAHLPRDRIRPRIPNGPRFPPRRVPGGDAGAYLAGRFEGSDGAVDWPCGGEVVLALPAADAIPFAGDAVVEALDERRCRVTAGSWCWAGLTASLARFDADIEVVAPGASRRFADLAAALDSGCWRGPAPLSCREIGSS